MKLQKLFILCLVLLLVPSFCFAGRSINNVLANDVHSKIVIGDGTNNITIDENGIILTGTKQVYNLIYVDLTSMKKGVGAPPGDGVEAGQATLDFDSATDEEVYSKFRGPKIWAPTSDAIFTIDWFVDTAPVGAEYVKLAIEYKSISIGDTFEFTGTSTVSTTAVVTTGTPANDKKTHTTNITIPNAGLIAGGILLVRIYRDTSVADDYSADARIFSNVIVYLSDRLGEAQ